MLNILYGRDIIESTFWAFGWTNWGRPRKIEVRIVGMPVKMQTDAPATEPSSPVTMCKADRESRRAEHWSRVPFGLQYTGNQDSSVDIVTGLRVGCSTDRGSNLDRSKTFFSIKRPHRLCASRSIMFNGYRELFPRRYSGPEREADHLLPSSVEVKTERRKGVNKFS